MSHNRLSKKLVWAIKNGRTDRVESLVKKRADIKNATDKNGDTVFTLAYNAENTEIIKMLIDMELVNKEDFHDKINHTSFTLASNAGNTKMMKMLMDMGAINVNDYNKKIDDLFVKAIDNKYSCDEFLLKRLLEAGANVNIKTGCYQKTPLMLACSNMHLQTVKLLLARGAQVNAKDKEGNTALIDTCYGDYCHNKIKIIVSVLLYRGAHVNATNNNKCTALMMACQCGFKDIVSLLIQKGADVNALDSLGETALMKACDKGNTEIVTLLLQNQANANVKSFNGDTAITKAKTKGSILGRYNGLVSLIKNYLIADKNKIVCPEKLICAVKDNNTERVLMISKDKNYMKDVVNMIDDEGASSLIIACKNGNTKIAKTLLKNNAWVNTRDNHGQTSLSYASRNGYKNTVSLLIENGADVNTPNIYGWTPLMLAGKSGHIEVVERLLKNGADVNMKNRTDQTALMVSKFDCRRLIIRRAEIIEETFMTSLITKKGCSKDNKPLVPYAHKEIIDWIASFF